MPEEKLQTLSLQVINGSELESGRAARCLFTQQGNVGHGPECHWSVQDRQQSIPAQAFTVILHDGTFCLRPQTAQLWLNQAKVTATSDLIQLRQGDEIQIGRLMVRVHLNRGDIPHYDEEMATPETIVTNRDMLTDTRRRSPRSVSPPVPCRTVDGRGGAGTACAAAVPDVVQDGIADDGGRLGAVPA